MNKNITFQNLWNTAKVVHREKLIPKMLILEKNKTWPKCPTKEVSEQYKHKEKEENKNKMKN